VRGGWNTDRLVRLATRLYALGYDRDWIAMHLFRPFPLEGPASWIDTWHAVRYGPAPGEIRQHLGQDIFCNRGEPVLATVRGVVTYSVDLLGGRVAHVTEPDGSFWYYAHLSGWNDEQIVSGQRVRPGRVIGFCGSSGNARGSPPHLHFGHYAADGRALDPLDDLVRWLRAARARALSTFGRSVHEARARIDVRTMARRFGLDWEPSVRPSSKRVPDFLRLSGCSSLGSGWTLAPLLGPGMTGGVCVIDPATVIGSLGD
jgi:murein DD-endopeptidase MepM/ murein hydrolase activator NlpD